MSSVLTAPRWLKERLTGDATLAAMSGGRVYLNSAPAGETVPYIILRQMSCDLLRGVGRAVIWWDEVWLVKAVTQSGNLGDLEALANRIREVLEAASGTTANGTVVGCKEEKPIQYEEVENGVTYQHLGFNFRIYTQ